MPRTANACTVCGQSLPVGFRAGRQITQHVVCPSGPQLLFRVGRFEVHYNGITLVSLWARASDEADFERLLETGRAFRKRFKRTGAGNDWGCDGVGYEAQKRLLIVSLHRSGVNRVAFREGLQACQQAEAVRA